MYDALSPGASSQDVLERAAQAQRTRKGKTRNPGQNRLEDSRRQKEERLFIFCALAGCISSSFYQNGRHQQTQELERHENHQQRERGGVGGGAGTFSIQINRVVYSAQKSFHHTTPINAVWCAITPPPLRIRPPPAGSRRPPEQRAAAGCRRLPTAPRPARARHPPPP